MTTLEAVVRRIADDLTGAQREFALVGGLAVSVRTEPRFTRDADLAVAVADDADAETLVQELRARGYRDVAIVEQEATGRMAPLDVADLRALIRVANEEEMARACVARAHFRAGIPSRS